MKDLAIALDNRPGGLAVTPDGKELWVVAIDASALVILETASRQVVAVPVGQRPHLVYDQAVAAGDGVARDRE